MNKYKESLGIILNKLPSIEKVLCKEYIMELQELVNKESKNQSELVENILYEFIYLDRNQEINYKNMTGEQVVNDYNKVIERLLDRYNIRLDNYYVRSEEDA